MLRDDLDSAARLKLASAVVASALRSEQGCTFDNEYCEANELDEDVGCSAGRRYAASGVWVVIIALAFVRLRRWAAMLVVALVIFTGSPASADEGRFGTQLGIAGSMDNEAAAISAGLRYRANDYLTVGMDVEYNPWFSIDSGRMEHGSLNAYGTAIYHHKTFGKWDLRSTVKLGASVMLFDMVGVDKGSKGIFVGASLLGLAVPLSEQLKLIIDPMEIAMPIPQVKGFPFYYRQYRFSTALQWSF
jgi:hypothetical protein